MKLACQITLDIVSLVGFSIWIIKYFLDSYKAFLLMSYLSMHIQIHILDSQFSHITTKSETKVKLIHIIYVLYNIYYNQTKRKLKRKLPYFASKLSFDWYEFEVILILQNFKIFVAKVSCNSKKSQSTSLRDFPIKLTMNSVF